jgi:hypothetical protein
MTIAESKLYPESEWRKAVAETDTILGYWSWVQAQSDPEREALKEKEVQDEEGNI